MSGVVRVEYTKYDGRRHWHFPSEDLGRDEHGWWLGGAPGTLLQRGEEPERHETGGFVLLIPAEGGWTATYNLTGDAEVYVDLTSPPVCTADSVTMVDLDLDVIRRRDGSVFLDDEDEFAEHQVKYGYPPELVAATEATARWLVEAVTAHQEPFGLAAPERLAQLTT